MKPTVTIAYFILAILFCSCTKPKENKTISLDSNWQFRKNLSGAQKNFRFADS